MVKLGIKTLAQMALRTGHALGAKNTTTQSQSYGERFKVGKAGVSRLNRARCSGDSRLARVGLVELGNQSCGG